MTPDFDESLAEVTAPKVQCKTCLWLETVDEPNRSKMRAAMATDITNPVLRAALAKHGYPYTHETLRNHRTKNHD